MKVLVCPCCQRQTVIPSDDGEQIVCVTADCGFVAGVPADCERIYFGTPVVSQEWVDEAGRSLRRKPA